MARQRSILSLLALVALLCGQLLSAAPAGAAPWYEQNKFASDLFYRQWARTDHEDVRSGRTWYWGPTPWFDYYEFYREDLGGTRVVQYFDKARMEQSKVMAAEVTNGLLVVEMVGGQLKLGNDPADNALRPPSDVKVAGDLGNDNSAAPTYRSFRSVATINDPSSNRNPERIGQSIGAVIDRDGNVTYNDALASAYAEQTRIVRYEGTTGHNIPRVLWDFLNQTGPVYNPGRSHWPPFITNEPVVDWLRAMGYPISDAYWVRTQVGGVERDVLVQLFERRVLTYTPSNPAGYQVEMGNVGQHYFLWRYPHLGQPWVGRNIRNSVAFQSSGAWPLRHIYEPGGEQHGLSNRADMIPHSWRHSYDIYPLEWVLATARADNGTKQIYAVAIDHGATYGVTDRPSESSPGNNEQPASSPDGTKIVFVSDRSGSRQLYMRHFWGNAGSEVQLTSGACANHSPHWSPDGAELVWVVECAGSAQIMKALIFYTEDRIDQPSDSDHTTYRLAASLVSQQQLTSSGNNTSPRFSPNGYDIVFESDRDGHQEIYLMFSSGGNQKPLSNSAAADSSPSWSPDGSQIVFSTNRNGNWNLYTMKADGSGQSQFTNTPADERRPVWQ